MFGAAAWPPTQMPAFFSSPLVWQGAGEGARCRGRDVLGAVPNCISVFATPCLNSSEMGAGSKVGAFGHKSPL